MKAWPLSALSVLLLVGAGARAQEGGIEWRHRANTAAVSVMANPLGRASRVAFYGARGFSAETLRPYAETCGFSFGMKHGGAGAIRARLADWRAIGADGRAIAFHMPESWDAAWARAGVSPAARIAFRWAQFQAENGFEPGDWIMGMATLEAAPAEPFRVVARYSDDGGSHDIVLERLACARD